MKIEQLYQIFLKSKSVTTNSRIVESNAIFFALKGENFNGNVYAKNALENGCSYSIVDDPEYVQSDKYILVNDVLKTLQLLGNYHRRQLNIPIIAITGTNGKTTTKELVANVLSKKYNVSYTKGNLNNHIGVPLTLLSMSKNTEIGIVEMGANHMNEIKDLCEIAEPNFGVITNIGKAHLEGFGSFDNIIKTKKELYEYIKTKNGKVFFNSNNSILLDIVKKLSLNSIAFGNSESRVYAEIIPSELFLSFNINIGDFKTIVKTQLIGNYNIENVLAAASIGYYNGINPELIVSAIEEYVPQNNRSQFSETTKNKLFLDAYNANPTSVEASVKNFVSLDIKNKCIVLGDMLELGKESKSEHKKILELLNNYSFDKIILVGKIYKSLDVKIHILQFENVDDLRIWIKTNNLNNFNILIKGSRGIQLEKIVELL